MNVEQLVNIVNGKVINPSANLEREIKGGFGGDLMSDVLATIQPEAVLLTGLCNPQVVRTAQVADVAAIVLVRGKCPQKETIDLAELERIPLISSPYGMYEICGRLFKAGLPSLENAIGDDPCDCN
jgi:predicted transcriptional regulator